MYRGDTQRRQEMAEPVYRGDTQLVLLSHKICGENDAYPKMLWYG